MPKILTKVELLAATERDYCALEGLLRGIDATRGSQPCCADGASIKDIVGQQAQRIGAVLGWLVDAGPSEPAPLPVETDRWPTGERPPDAVDCRQGDLDWNCTRALLANRHAKLVHVLSTMSEADLYERPLPGRSEWTVGQYAEVTGAGYYRRALTCARNCLNSGQSPEIAVPSC